MSFLSQQVAAGFSEAFALARDLSGGEQGASVSLAFNGNSAPAVAVSIAEGRDMLPAGYHLDFDASCVLLLSDFTALGPIYESEMTLDGQRLQLKKWVREYPFVTLFLSAIR